MTEKKTVNWKEIAENSDNPEIKEKYELFKAETDEQKQRSLRGMIVAMIKTEAAEKAAAKEPEQPADPTDFANPETPEVKAEMERVAEAVAAAENAQPEPEKPVTIDKDELSDVEKLRFWKDRIVILESSRLKNETYAQRRELNRKIFEANEQIAKLREKIRNDKRAKKLAEIKQSGRVSSLALKQAKVEHLIQKGFSLTNITKHPDGVKKTELQKIIESNGFLGRIESKYHGFTAMWERWKAKFLK